MGNVIAPIGGLQQTQIALDHDQFGTGGNALEAKADGDLARVHVAAGGERRLFGMLDDQQIEGRGVTERAAHHHRIGHGPRRVGKGDGAGGGQQTHLGHGFAAHALGDGAVGPDVDPAGFAAVLFDHLDHGGVVDHRVGVGQARHGGDATGGGGAGRGDGGFLVLLAGIAELHPHIDQARRQHMAGAIDGGDALGHAVGEQPGADIGDGGILGQ